MHAKLLAQSELVTHSGRQLGGLPINESKQEHDGASPIGLQREKGPQGEGRQGSRGSTSLTGLTNSVTERVLFE